MKRSLLGLITSLLFTLAAVGAESPPRWTVLTTPRLNLYTAKSVPEARDWVVRLEAFRVLVSRLGPADDRALEPMIAVVFRSEPEFLEYFKAPAEKTILGAKVKYLVAAAPYGKFGRTFCAVDPAHADIAEPAFFLQAGLWATQMFPRSLPTWLTMGLQEMCVESKLRSDRVDFGERSKVNVNCLDRKIPLPLDRLMQQQETMGDVVYAEAWALSHFLLWGDNGAHRAALLRYIEAWENGATEPEAFAAAFPAGMEDLTTKLARYVKAGSFKGESIPLSAVKVADIHAEAATDAAVETVMGYLRIAAGSLTRVQEHFDRALELDPLSTATFEAEGYLALHQNDMTAAEDYFRQAVEAGSQWHLAHAYRAMALGRPVLGMETTADHSDPALARKTAEALQEVMRLNPYYSPSYEWYGGLIASLGEVTAKDEEVLAKALKLYPNAPGPALGMVALHVKRGELDVARQDLERLTSGTPPLPENLHGYARKLWYRTQAALQCRRIHELFEAGELNAATEAFSAVPRANFSREEIRSLETVEQTTDSFVQIREAMGRKQYGLAAGLVDMALKDDLPEKIRAQLKDLGAEIAEARARP